MTAARMSRLRRGLPIIGLLAPLALAGCSRTEEYLEVARAQQKAMEDVTEVLARIRDEKDMAAAREALDARFARFEAIARKARDLPKPPPPEVAERLDQAAFRRAFDAMGEQIQRVKELPGGKEFLQSYDSMGMRP
jgi:hypothetical protein